MHWCAYPSPTHSLIQVKNKSANTETAKHNQQAQHNRQPLVMKTVGVTGKTAKWLQKTSSKSFYIVPSPKRKCFTDIEA